LRPVAVKSLKQSLVITEVARKENIQISREDIQNNIETMTKDLAADKKDNILQFLNLPQSQMGLASSIATRKTVEKLTEIATSPAEEAGKTENTETEITEEKAKLEETKNEGTTGKAEARKGKAAKKEA
jgi:trigger factor